MSGHNKWSQIKHKKGVVDAKKSKVFGKLSRLISAESRNAKGDITSPALRSAIEKARAANMPNENIERAVKKGIGEGGQIMENIVYEAYGPGGCALIIEVLTDNRNRTAQEIKHLLSSSGASLAEIGAASWAFEKKEGTYTPTTTIPLNDGDVQKLEILLEKLDEHDDVQNIYTNTE